MPADTIAPTTVLLTDMQLTDCAIVYVCEHEPAHSGGM